jgi:SNW domain-containing protein 1
VDDSQVDAVMQREGVRDQRKREREDDRRESMKKSKTSRDRDRDVSEKIALGQAGRLTRQGESLYDARLFNQDQVCVLDVLNLLLFLLLLSNVFSFACTSLHHLLLFTSTCAQGMGHGLQEEDSYNIYDKPLMSGSSANQLYRPNKERIAEFQDDMEMDAVETTASASDTSRFKADKGFEGAQSSSSSARRSRPVEFERAEDAESRDKKRTFEEERASSSRSSKRHAEEEEEEDPFGLEDFMSKAKGKDDNKDRSGGSRSGGHGVMSASAGGSMGGDRSNRDRVKFTSGR